MERMLLPSCPELNSKQGDHRFPSVFRFACSVPWTPESLAGPLEEMLIEKEGRRRLGLVLWSSSCLVSREFNAFAVLRGRYWRTPAEMKDSLTLSLVGGGWRLVGH